MLLSIFLPIIHTARCTSCSCAWRPVAAIRTTTDRGGISGGGRCVGGDGTTCGSDDPVTYSQRGVVSWPKFGKLRVSCVCLLSSADSMASQRIGELTHSHISPWKLPKISETQFSFSCSFSLPVPSVFWNYCSKFGRVIVVVCFCGFGFICMFGFCFYIHCYSSLTHLLKA